MTIDEKTPDNIAYERLNRGLKQDLRVADWDPDTYLHGCDEWATFGVTDGAMWGTDRSTALIERAEGLEDTKFAESTGRAVLALANLDGLTGPTYVVKVRHLGLCGGCADTQLGAIDLKRLSDAAMWTVGWFDDSDDAEEEAAAGEETVRILVVTEKKFCVLTTDSHPERVAFVMLMSWKDDVDWHPTVELPVERRGGK